MINDIQPPEQDPTGVSSTDDPFQVKINRIKNRLPKSGFDGLTELLGLLEEMQMKRVQRRQIDETDVEDSALMLNEVLQLVEQHLEQPLDDERIDDLLFGVDQICTGIHLNEEDLFMFKELLRQDGGQQVVTPVVASSEQANARILQEVKQYQDQLNHFAELSETKGLMGIQDLLFALRGKLEWQREQDTDDVMFTETDVAGLKNLVSAATDYFTLNNIDAAVQQLFQATEQLSGQSIVAAEDVEKFSQLLINEIADQSNSGQQSQQGIEEDTGPDPSAVGTAIEVSETGSIVPQHLNEFLNLLQLSVQELESSLTEMLPALYASLSNLDQNQVLCDNFEVELNKFAGVTAIANFDGLRQSCEHLQENYLELKKHNFKITQEDSQNWRNWIKAVIDYLQSPLDPERMQQLLIVHSSPGWSTELGETKTTELLISLRALDSESADSEQPHRQTEATDEDVSLQLPDDVYPELLESLLQELPLLTEQFSAAIQSLSQGGPGNHLATAQRVAHTIKGAANTVGIRGIANVTHHLEDILTALTNADSRPGKFILGTFVKASDCLEEMSEAIANNSPVPSDAKQVLQEILDLASRIDREGVAIIADEISEQITAQTTIVESNNTPPSKPVVPEESAEAVIRVPITIVDKLMQFSNQIMITNGQLRERLRQTGGKAQALQSQLDLIYELGLELEELVDIRNYDLLKGAIDSTATNNFDSLEMDQYNELHTCSRRIHEVATDIREMGSTYQKELMDIDNRLIEQDHLNTASQNDLLTMRLVPVQSVLPRLQRSVRQACRLTGKNAELEITGADVYMDRDILNGIVDPLMHVLRNAVDHGIESYENRLACSKQPTGAIALSFQRVGNMIEIQCRDDGAGLNLEVIRAKAIERGMISDGIEITEDELKQLIFQPNFSTSENVTQVSGRGVGMDAVNTGIRTLGGTLTLNSEIGQGCQLTISLPLSLVNYHSLLVKIGTHNIALAEHSIEQILHPGAGVLKRDDEELNFIFEDKVYVVKTLDALLGRMVPDNSIALEKRIIVLVQLRMTRYAVLVESIVGVKELVVKGFGGFVPPIHGVIGASILDNGSIAPVLDVQKLLEESSRWSRLDLDQIGIAQENSQSCALVVDDSLSARRSLEQFVGDLGFTVMAARDGQEAIEMINNRIPDIVITDMEMPRINGIELTEFIRANPDTSHKHIPIIMITSRSTNKHKLLAQSKGVDVYLTKPYSEQVLTNHMMDLVNSPDQLKQAIAG